MKETGYRTIIWYDTRLTYVTSTALTSLQDTQLRGSLWFLQHSYSVKQPTIVFLLKYIIDNINIIQASLK